MNGKKQLGVKSLLGMSGTLGLNPNIAKTKAKINKVFIFVTFPLQCEM